MSETWKVIHLNTNYEVSNLGRVRNKKGLLLKPQKTEKGYLRVDLSKDGKTKHYKVHRLVASAFIPNKNNLPQINHKDENKQNNRVDNLEWCTHKENTQHAFKTGLYDNKLNMIRKPVVQYDLKFNKIKVWSCAEEVKNKLNIGHIASVCKGERKTAGGYIWRYLDDRNS